MDKNFWVAVFERAVKTVAATALPLIAGASTGLVDVDWANVASVSGAAGLCSILFSMGSFKLGNNTGPSLSTEAVVK